MFCHFLYYLWTGGADQVTPDHTVDLCFNKSISFEGLPEHNLFQCVT